MPVIKRVASSMWCRMSWSAATTELKGIDSVGRHGRADIGLQSLTAHHVHWSLEQARNVFFQADIIEHCHAHLGIKIDDNIEVTVGPVLATRRRAEHGGVVDAARTQRALMAAE